MVIDAVVALNPLGPVQLYVVPPVAVNVTAPPIVVYWMGETVGVKLQ